MEGRFLPGWLIFSIPEVREGFTPDVTLSPDSPAKNMAFPAILAVGGVFAALAVVLALITALYAIVRGHTEVLIWLVWGHLPWFILQRQKRQHAKRHRGLWDGELSKRSSGDFLWMPVKVKREGITAGQLFSIDWKQFADFELLKQAEEYFVVRFWLKEEVTDSRKFPGAFLLPDDHTDTRLRRFARLVPILVTILSLIVGNEQFGWRADVRVAFYLTIHYAFTAYVKQWLRKALYSVNWGKETRSLDVAFDSRKVTADEATAQLKRYLPKQDDWI